jgi:hypothetical protein
MTTSIGITCYKRLTLAIEDHTDLHLTSLTDWAIPLLSLAAPSFGHRQAPWEVVTLKCELQQESNMSDRTHVRDVPSGRQQKACREAI